MRLVRWLRRAFWWGIGAIVSLAGRILERLRHLAFALPLTIILYVLYLRLPSLAAQPVTAEMVTLLTLMLVAFVLWWGGPSIISRVQEIGPLKLTPRLGTEVDRALPEIERELRDVTTWFASSDAARQGYEDTLSINPPLPPEKIERARRLLHRIGSLLLTLRLMEEPAALPDRLKLLYVRLAYWESRLLYHLEAYDEAITRWESLWRLGGAGLLERTGEPELLPSQFCLYLGHAYSQEAVANALDVDHREASYEAAIRWYLRAVSHDRDLIEAFFFMAWAYDDLERYIRAIATLDDLLKIDPTFTAALYNRACANAKAGNVDQAWADLRRLPCPDPLWCEAENDVDFEPIRQSQYAGLFAAMVVNCCR